MHPEPGGTAVGRRRQQHPNSSYQQITLSSWKCYQCPNYWTKLIKTQPKLIPTKVDSVKKPSSYSHDQDDLRGRAPSKVGSSQSEVSDMSLDSCDQDDLHDRILSKLWLSLKEEEVDLLEELFVKEGIIFDLQCSDGIIYLEYLSLFGKLMPYEAQEWQIRAQPVWIWSKTGPAVPSTESSGLRSTMAASCEREGREISRSVDGILKRKSPVVKEPICVPVKPRSRLPWPPPPTGMVALSVDGSYCATDGSAGSGMILRTRTGEVIFAAYRKLFHCNDALQAELHVVLEGIKLTTEHSEATIMVQSDCAAAINALSDASLDKSAYGHMVQKIKFLLSDRVFVPVKVSRDQNRVADCLANYGRCGDSTTCWLGHSPPCASDLVAEDCNCVILE
ncbi:autophagy-related protein 7 [Hordeum vulgare]|nr:autophagy-related protein 7 [Hordeum vulgare]